MGADDDADCVEHVWVLQGVSMDEAGSHSDYECSRCGIPMVSGPGPSPA